MMDFRMSLLAVGLAVIVIIIAYNKWQEYRAKKSIDRAFAGDHDDVLMSPKDRSERTDRESLRQEPQFDGEALDDFVPEDGEPGVPDEIPAQTDAQVATIDDEQALSVDELIDCVITLEFEAPLRGEKLLNEIGDLKFIGRKPVHFIGLTLEGKRDEIAHGGIYSTLFAGIQMVSRHGPLNELEYSEFVSQLRDIADRLNAHSDVPDMNLVMSNARELHQFVAEHDAQLSVNVISNGAPWDVNTLMLALEKLGFDVRADGRLVMPDGDVGNLFTLSMNVSASETATSKLTLLLDVPCVAPDLEGFAVMAKCARSLAVRLGGTVVDDSHHPISEQALAEIAQQVSDFCNAMAVAEIPAGSRRAKRLFS